MQAEDRARRRRADRPDGAHRRGRRCRDRGRRERELHDRGCPALAPLDDLGLQCIEQPLGRDAIGDHAALAQRWRTPICLDESITSASAARDAIRAGACGIVSIKLGRLGGLLAARRVHDECTSSAIPVLAGGMLETGIGRAAAIALASLPGFTETGDLSASARYFAEDLTEPFVLDNGALRVPTRPGLGVEMRDDVLARATVEHELLRAGGI